MTYYYTSNNKQIGPVSEEDIIKLYNSGSINRDTLIWANGWEEWKKLGQTEINKQLPPPLPSHNKEKTKPDNYSSGNYIVSSWLGEKSLAMSYWVNGFLLTFVLQIIIGLYNSAAALFPQIARGNVKLYYTIALVFEIIAISVAIWQTVGIWRAAENHKIDTGKKGLATLAQIAIVLTAVAVFAKIGTLGSYYNDVFWNAIGKDTLGNYTTSMSEDKTTLTVNGIMAFGLASDVDKILANNSGIKKVILNSDGGRIWEGENLYDVLKNRNISETSTETGCASACTIPFLAADIRTVKDDKALLGFHSSSSPYYVKTASEAENRRWQTFMLSHGIEGDFARKAISIPPNEMWNPKYSELREAGFVKRDYGAMNNVYQDIKNDGLLKPFDVLYKQGFIEGYSYYSHRKLTKANVHWNLSFIGKTDKHEKPYDVKTLGIGGTDFDRFNTYTGFYKINCADKTIIKQRNCSFTDGDSLENLQYHWIMSFSDDYCRKSTDVEPIEKDIMYKMACQ